MVNMPHFYITNIWEQRKKRVQRKYQETMCYVTHEQAVAHDTPTTTMDFVFLGC